MPPTQASPSSLLAAPPHVPAEWTLPEPLRASVSMSAGRQRVLAAEGHTLVVLHAPPEHDTDTRVARLYWKDPSGKWRSNDRSHAAHDSAELAAAVSPGSGMGSQGVFRKLLDEYHALVELLDDREEEATRSDQYFDVLERLSPIVRASHNLQTALADASKADPGDRTLARAAERAYEMSRRVELIQHDAKLAFEFLATRHMEEQAEGTREMAQAAHRLNLMVSFFFPVATLGTIFGMNLATGLEAAWPPWPMLGVLAVGMSLGVLLFRFVKQVGPPGRLSR